MIILVLGGSRSGKSALAEDLVARLSEPITYVATGQVTDDDMAARIDTHQARRPASWATVEAPGATLAKKLASIEGSVLLDSLGTWLAGHHDFEADVDLLCEVLDARVGTTVIVSDEVGMGVHPATPLGRMFRDQLGLVNQRVAGLADRVVLAVAGRALELQTASGLLDDLARVAIEGSAEPPSAEPPSAELPSPAAGSPVTEPTDSASAIAKSDGR